VKRIRDDICEISESRQVWSGNPAFTTSKVVAWERWHHFESPNGNQIGHMIGVTPRTGDFEADCEANRKMIDEHNETCELRKRFEVEEEPC
jgi:hypothetical protein